MLLPVGFPAVKDAENAHRPVFVIQLHYDSPITYPQTVLMTPPNESNDVTLTGFGEPLNGGVNAISYISIEARNVA